jgi:hypothetical protein
MVDRAPWRHQGCHAVQAHTVCVLSQALGIDSGKAEQEQVASQRRPVWAGCVITRGRSHAGHEVNELPCMPSGALPRGRGAGIDDPGRAQRDLPLSCLCANADMGMSDRVGNDLPDGSRPEDHAGPTRDRDARCGSSTDHVGEKTNGGPMWGRITPVVHVACGVQGLHGTPEHRRAAVRDRGQYDGRRRDPQADRRSRSSGRESPRPLLGLSGQLMAPSRQSIDEVLHREVVERQGVRDQAPMAAPPHRLRAHDRQRLAGPRPRFQLRQRAAERGRRHVAAVRGERW